MIKIITTNFNVSSVSISFSIFAYSSIHVQQTDINIDDQVARAPANQTFANQFKYITRGKFKVFVVKVATKGPSSNHFCELNTKT